MRRPRLTIRTMMIALAVLALPLGVLVERRHRFARIAERFRPALVASMPIAMSHSYTRGVTERADWNVRMFHKYEYAARYPWLSVEPDPPMPK